MDFIAIGDGGAGDAPLEDLKDALHMAGTLWGIRKDGGATNSDRPAMAVTRETFLNTIENDILRKLGIENRGTCDDVHANVHSQPPQQDEYTEFKNMVQPNPPRLTLRYDTLTTCEGKLKAAVLRRTESRVVAVLAIGKGGVGKTCALRGLAEDRRIQEEFSGGILFIELGNDATIGKVVRGIANTVEGTGGATLANEIRTVKSVGEASLKASKWFGEHSCLFLVDDIWNLNGIDSEVLEDLQRMVNANSQMIYTTRDRYFVHDTAVRITFEEKEPHGDLCRQMLMTHAELDADVELEAENKVAFEYFLTLCQGLPLGLGIIGSSVMMYSLDCTPKENAWSEFYKYFRLQQGDLMRTKTKSYGALPKIVNSSVYVLVKRSRRGEFWYWFRALSVVQKQQSVPAEMLQKLWGLDTLQETRDVIESFADVSVVQISRKHGSVYVRLHDLVRKVAIHQAAKEGETESLHQNLVRSYMANGEGRDRGDSTDSAMSAADWELCYAWWKVKEDGYIRHNICRILRKAGYVKQLLWLLSQPQWIVKRLLQDGILGLEDDLDQGVAVCKGNASQHENHLRMIGQAGRMSALFVNWNARVEEAWFQVHGRLQWHATQSELTKTFVERMEKCAPELWLKASAGLLLQAGIANTQVISISGGVSCIREERDAIWVLSRSEDNRAVYVGKYDSRGEWYREQKLQMDEDTAVSRNAAAFLRDEPPWGRGRRIGTGAFACGTHALAVARRLLQSNMKHAHLLLSEMEQSIAFLNNNVVQAPLNERDNYAVDATRINEHNLRS